MMSPLAVAQYLPKNSVKFDLCIIDEASQMPPELAIGALLRCDQAVVVGDTNQLPPSSFFKTLIDDEDADDDVAVLNESVLEMAKAFFVPPAVCAGITGRGTPAYKVFEPAGYDDKLIVFPSATEAMSRMGVSIAAWMAGTRRALIRSRPRLSSRRLWSSWRPIPIDRSASSR